MDIVGGDWNSVTNPYLDRDGGTRNHTRDAKEIHTLHSLLKSMANPNRELQDGWRVLHPKDYDFTHKNRGRASYSRIDRLYMREDWVVCNVLELQFSGQTVVRYQLPNNFGPCSYHGGVPVGKQEIT